MDNEDSGSISVSVDSSDGRIVLAVRGIDRFVFE
jgi:hypothetical protein